MSYQRPERLGSQGERRVIGILTLTNVLGFLVGLGGMWTLGGGLGLPHTLSMGLLLRLLVALAGGVMGVVATFRWTGLSLWDQVVLWGGYLIRRSTGQTRITPVAAVGVGTARVIAPVRRNGKVIADAYDPAAAAGASGEA